MKKKEIFSIGHSTHDLNDFLDLLNQHKITAIADVRSTPYSRRFPQFNRENLKKSLKKTEIAYVFLGEELGARSDNPCCYNDNDKVDYEKVSETILFKEGMKRLADGAKNFNICMMCSEKEPLDCHRSILIGRHLDQDQFILKHIKSDGSLETHNEAMDRYIGNESQQADMFSSKEEKLISAYKKRGKEIAYKRK